MLKRKEEAQRQEYLKQIRTITNEISYLETCLNTVTQKANKKRSREDDYAPFMYDYNFTDKLVMLFLKEVMMLLFLNSLMAKICQRIQQIFKIR